MKLFLKVIPLVKGEGCYNRISEDSILLYALSEYNLALRPKVES